MNFRLGDHIVVSRFGYTHHGIVSSPTGVLPVTVIHYNKDWDTPSIREERLIPDFVASEQQLHLVSAVAHQPLYSGEDIVRTARKGVLPFAVGEL
jgi:hypothetical protein